MTPVGEGADCTNTECTAGLVCDANRCFKPGAEGAACTDEQPCGVALECVQGKCTKLLAPGAACEKESSLCDVFGGYTCVRDGEGTTGTCQPIEFAPVGQPCGVDLTTGKVTSCAASSCSDLAENGSCVAPLVEGAACSELEGPGCEVGLECRDGSCQRPDLACN